MNEPMLRLEPDNILLEMTARSKEGALHELVAVLQRQCPAGQPGGDL